MTWEQMLMVLTSATALVGLLLAVLAWRRVGRVEAEMHTLHAHLAAAQAPVSGVSPPVSDDLAGSTFLITHFGEDRAEMLTQTPQRIEGRLFADIVARETVVKAASWTHGVRRALSPHSRNRIRFHMRQETKRAGRDRRAEMKTALREYRARARADEEDVA